MVKRLLDIVFADEGEIRRHSADADLDCNRLIRPWKSRLARRDDTLTSAALPGADRPVIAADLRRGGAIA